MITIEKLESLYGYFTSISDLMRSSLQAGKVHEHFDHEMFDQQIINLSDVIANCFDELKKENKKTDSPVLESFND